MDRVGACHLQPARNPLHVPWRLCTESTRPRARRLRLSLTLKTLSLQKPLRRQPLQSLRRRRWASPPRGQSLRCQHSGSWRPILAANPSARTAPPTPASSQGWRNSCPTWPLQSAVGGGSANKFANARGLQIGGGADTPTDWGFSARRGWRGVCKQICRRAGLANWGRRGHANGRGLLSKARLEGGSANTSVNARGLQMGAGSASAPRLVDGAGPPLQERLQLPVRRRYPPPVGHPIVRSDASKEEQQQVGGTSVA